MINKTILVGRLGRDPEIRSTNRGDKIANLRVATSETWRDKNSGEKRERTEWHSIVIFGDGLANVCEQFLQKGSLVYIEGQLQTRKWQDNSGADRYTTEIVLQGFNGKLQILAGGITAEERGETRSRTQVSSGKQETYDDLDDDIPF